MTTPLPFDPSADRAEMISASLRQAATPSVEKDSEFSLFQGPAISKLSRPHREFVLHLCIGDAITRGRPWMAYIQAGYSPSTKEAAAVGAYQLKKREDVAAAIKEVTDEVEAHFRARIGTFVEEAVIAKDLLKNYLLTLSGTPPLDSNGNRVPVLIGANGLAAIREVLDRAIGRPVQRVEKDVGERVDSLIRDLANKRKALPQGAASANDSMGDGNADLGILGEVLEEDGGGGGGMG